MKNNGLLEQAKKADYVFISVMGPHANETPEEIYEKKNEDLKRFGESFWVSGVDEQFITECKRKLKGKVGYLILVESSGDGKSAADTKGSEPATKYSENRVNWKEINVPNVTGNMHKDGTPAYYFDKIELYEEREAPINLSYNINLNYYSEDGKKEAIKFRQGRSNVFAKKNTAKLSGGMNSHERKIVAVLRLKYPYVVWVK